MPLSSWACPTDLARVIALSYLLAYEIIHGEFVSGTRRRIGLRPDHQILIPDQTESCFRAVRASHITQTMT